jgi:DedD protein
MAEQHFREIQLSGKQLVFLFMTSVVVAVGVFLLGVSVGRGTVAGADGVVETVADVAPSSELPPPTEIAPGELDYFDVLKQNTTPPAEPEPAAAPGVSPDELDPVAEPIVERPSAPVTSPAPAPAPAVASGSPASPAARPAAAVTNGWSVQVGAFRSLENAERQVQQLKTKGFAASVAPGTPGSLYRVRVGPFAQRAEADRTAARLSSEEGLKPSVTR